MSEAKMNQKRFIIYLKAEKKIKNNIGPLFKENGAPTQDNKKMDEIMNKNLASVFTKGNTDMITGTLTPSGEIEPWKLE